MASWSREPLKTPESHGLGGWWVQQAAAVSGVPPHMPGSQSHLCAQVVGVRGVFGSPGASGRHRQHMKRRQLRACAAARVGAGDPPAHLLLFPCLVHCQTRPACLLQMSAPLSRLPPRPCSERELCLGDSDDRGGPHRPYLYLSPPPCIVCFPYSGQSERFPTNQGLPLPQRLPLHLGCFPPCSASMPLSAPLPGALSPPFTDTEPGDDQVPTL